MQVINRNSQISYTPVLRGLHAHEATLNLLENSEDRSVFLLFVPAAFTHQSLQFSFKFKAINVKGSWSSNAILDKRFRTDWEMPQVEASISVNAPIISLFGHQDENLLTVGCSDAVHLLKMELALREEDNHFYCNLKFFESKIAEGDYSTKIVIDKTKNNFSQIIQKAANWVLSENEIINEIPPALANVPLYSTWYSFHQNLLEEELLEECKIAKTLGYDLIIIDDGWQTLDSGRGYDFTGDWEPDRFKDVKTFVKDVHATGMAIMFWFSVPFCGKKSKAYQRFRGKFLTENHHWAPVFDPRFPEVREYLVNIYCKALSEWNIDGFKLDFIDDFMIYPETELKKLEGRDTLSVSEGTNRLINEISSSLKAIKADTLIEFRQKYISPSLHKLGNMFRAFDCPNDSLMNRVRTTDVKLIAGNAAVHSDMITWHKEEPLEVAALQFTSIMFSVLQLSVRLRDRSGEEIQMIRFFTNYWRAHKSIFVHGSFIACKPLANYPCLCASNEEKRIYGLYEDVVLPIDATFQKIDIINGKTTREVILRFLGDLCSWNIEIKNCKGEKLSSKTVHINQALLEIDCPANGIIFLSKTQ